MRYFILLGLLLGSVTLIGADDNAKKIEKGEKSAKTEKSQKLSKSEMMKKYDKDNDGKLSTEEKAEMKKDLKAASDEAINEQNEKNSNAANEAMEKKQKAMERKAKKKK